MLENLKNNFNPLLFLASLGAGGIAVSAFMFIQYGGIFNGKGLATLADIGQTPLTIFLEIIMIIFAVIHVILTTYLLIGFFAWKKSDDYQKFSENPLVNSGLMAPLLSLAMSMNVVIAVARYFLELLSGNFQALFGPAFIGFFILWAAIMWTAITLLKKAFTTSFDVTKIHFGWLLQPFSLSMITVTGTGFAALAKNTETITYNTDIAAAAAFLAVISGTMAVFLLSVKMFSIFTKHLQKAGTFENQFMPTYLIVIPIITLLGISAYRLGHYAETIYHAPILFTLAKLVVFVLFAFQVWYFAFGLAMLGPYWKSYLHKKFHVSQWGLICPFVAFVALGLFFHHIFFANVLFFGALFLMFLFVIGLYFFLLKRQFDCLCSKDKNNVCD